MAKAKKRWPQPLADAVRRLHKYEQGHTDSGLILVGLSGGADSLALAVIAAEAARTSHTGNHAPFTAGAVIVDHQLQNGSAHVAHHAAHQARELGLNPVLIHTVDVATTGSLEAAARTARYQAFNHAVADTHATTLLTAHTADDQAEQVLLGLTRGSGTRSLAGIRESRSLSEQHPETSVFRPILGLRRVETEEICRWAGLEWWEDPTNADPKYLRSRIRTEVLPRLEDPQVGLGAGVRAGLVRTASLAAEDADALDMLAEHLLAEAIMEPGRTTDGLPMTAAQREPNTGRKGGRVVVKLNTLVQAPAALSKRVIGLCVSRLGVQRPTRERTEAVYLLLARAHTGSHSAGPVQLPGDVTVYRRAKLAENGCGTLEFIRAEKPAEHAE